MCLCCARHCGYSEQTHGVISALKTNRIPSLQLGNHDTGPDHKDIESFAIIEAKNYEEGVENKTNIMHC